jgi:hypothetical protein
LTFKNGAKNRVIAVKLRRYHSLLLLALHRPSRGAARMARTASTCVANATESCKKATQE